MSQHQKIWPSLFAILVIGVSLFFWLGVTEDPVVQNRHLSEWIKLFSIWDSPQPTPAATVLTANAKKAEPLLRNMLRARDSSLGLKIRQWIVQQKIFKLQHRTATQSQSAALGVCNWLGQEVQGTAPAIAQLVNDYPTRMKDRAIMDYALHTLAIMDTNGVQELVRLLEHPDPYICRESARLLGTVAYPDGKVIAAALRGCQARKDENLSRVAAFSLDLVQRRLEQRIRTVTDKERAGTAESTVRLTNLWSVQRGLEITATSGLESGYTGQEIFEGRGPGPEPTRVVLQGSQADGFVHFIEWKVPAPLTIQAFGFLASHEGGNVNFQRAFREFRLLAWNEAEKKFQPFYDELVTVPYGQGFYSDAMACFRNLAVPVRADRFRLEVVQMGSGPWYGPRLIELYGFDSALTEAQTREITKQQEQPFRDMQPKLAEVRPD